MDNEKLYAVAVGNPFDGITLYGPFTNEEQEDFAAGLSGVEWWTIELHPE